MNAPDWSEDDDMPAEETLRRFEALNPHATEARTIYRDNRWSPVASR